MEQSTLLLLYTRTPAEEGLLQAWMEDSGRTGAPSVHAGRDELEPQLATNGNGSDPKILPVRVAWLPPERRGDRRAGLRDLIAMRNPRDPRASSQEKIGRADPSRSRGIVGEPASVSGLRARFADTGGG